MNPLLNGEWRVVSMEADSIRCQMGVIIGQRYVFTVFLAGDVQNATGTDE